MLDTNADEPNPARTRENTALPGRLATGRVERADANLEAVKRMFSSEPALVDVRPAGETIPGFACETILTSGAPLDWPQYVGGQRAAILGAAIYEGLARDRSEAEAKLATGEIALRSCGDLRCAGSLAGVYTASMPVLVVEDAVTGLRAFCTLFEGGNPRRLNYGIYDSSVRASLEFLRDIVGPTLSAAVQSGGRISLRPIMRRALHMGDELHSRNTAATMLFAREVFPALLESRAPGDHVRRTLEYLSNDYFFLRLGMASAKIAADAAQGVEGASVVTGMVFNCRDFAIRVSGLGDRWFRGPLPSLSAAKFFEGYVRGDAEFMGGESTMMETIGLGAFAQAAAFPLQAYQGGSVEAMIALNLEMYQICVTEHPEFKIPYFGFRGTPVGIDIYSVLKTGLTPVLDIGLAGKQGGQIGAGVFRAPIECFEVAAAYAHERAAQVDSV